MKKDPKIIADEIIRLVSELAALAGVPKSNSSAQPSNSPPSEEKDWSGATGGIRLLIEEGEMDSPKQLSEIIELLKQKGRHYSNPAVSMGLLNLKTDRILTRFKDRGEKNWKYVVRR